MERMAGSRHATLRTDKGTVPQAAAWQGMEVG